MCTSNRSLSAVVEVMAVILLTISVLIIGATLHLYDTTAETLAISVVICLLNILSNISLIFGLKDKSSTFFVLLWMMSALCNILGGIALFGFYMYNGNNLFNDPTYVIALNLMKNIFLISYVGLYIWLWIQVYNLHKIYNADEIWT